MHKKRPVNLYLPSIRFPITAIVSILHRLSGVLLCGFAVALLWVLDQSLQSAAAFDALKYDLAICPVAKILLWLFLSSLFFHLVAGIRHLLMDMGIGEGKHTGSYGAYSVIGLTVIFTILLGINLC